MSGKKSSLFYSRNCCKDGYRDRDEVGQMDCGWVVREVCHVIRGARVTRMVYYIRGTRSRIAKRK